MTRRTDLKLAVLGVACTAALALATGFTWVGQGEDDRWDTCDNWAAVVPPQCYPNTSSDDPLIPYDEEVESWAVNLIDVPELGVMIIKASVDFGGATDAPPTIQPTWLFFDPDDEDIEVTISGAQILVGIEDSP